MPRRHLSERQLLDGIEGELGAAQHDACAAHLAACAACRARRDRLAHTAQAVQTTFHTATPLPAAEVRRSWAAVAPHLRLLRRTRTWRGLLGRAASSLLTIAALVALTLGLSSLLSSIPPAVESGTPMPLLPQPSVQPTPAPQVPPAPLPWPTATSGAVNLLLLGGDQHTGDTDTIMLLMLDPIRRRAVVVTIPAGLWVTVPGHGQRPLAQAYALGEADEFATGLTLARDTVSMALEVPIHHALHLDFAAFEQVIDAAGGVAVEVPHAIVDPLFPDGAYGYAPFGLDAGLQHMDGETALKYVRTRVVPAPGFDRPARQQQLVLALRAQLADPSALGRMVSQAPQLWSALQDDIDTNMSLNAVLDLALHATATELGQVEPVRLDECCVQESTNSAGETVMVADTDALARFLAP